MTYTSGGPVFNKKQKDAMSWGLQPLVLEERTATADDVTPDIANVNVLKIGANTGGTAITQLDGGIAGQVMVLIGTSATNSSTIADSGNFKLNGSTWTASVDETLVLYTSNGTTWIELSRSAN